MCSDAQKTRARFKGVREAHQLRTFLPGVLLSIFNAALSYFGAMGFSALELPSFPYQFLILTLIVFFIGARYFGKSIFYTALLTHILLLLFAIFLMANNFFMFSEEFSEPFLTTLIRRYPYLLFELTTVTAALSLGILSKNYVKGK